MSLVQMTVSSGAFILFIAAVRALALHRLPKGAFPALWEMAALRLLLPFTIPLPLGVFAPANDLPIVGAYLAAGGGFAPDTPPGGISAGTPALAGTAPSAVLPMVWLAGAALMAAYFTASYVRARRRFGCSTPDNTPAVRRWLAERTLRRPLEVRRSALASSPLTYGVLHPVILLPEDMERGGDALVYILSTPLEGGTCVIDKTGVPLDDWDTVRAPEYTEEEWQQIIAGIESGKIPPLEIPDDPNVTVRFVDYPGGNCTAKD